MNKTKIAKFVVSSVTGAGTLHVSNGIIKNNVDFDDLNSFGKFTVNVASAVLGSMATAKTKEYTDSQIDQIVNNWNEARSSTTEAPTLSE